MFGDDCGFGIIYRGRLRDCNREEDGRSGYLDRGWRKRRAAFIGIHLQLKQ